jgi:hypothetical protein
VLIMGCGCNKSRSTTVYRVKYNDGSSKDYATPGQHRAHERRRDGARARRAGQQHPGSEQVRACDLAEIGYRAYGDEAEWVNHAGNTMPSWVELPAPQRSAWQAAAAAIARAATGGRTGPSSAYAASHPDGPGPDPGDVDANRGLQLVDEAPGCSGPCSGSNTGGRA